MINSHIVRNVLIFVGIYWNFISVYLKSSQTYFIEFDSIYNNLQGYGQADHSETRRILLTKYPDYEIETSDDGY